MSWRLCRISCFSGLLKLSPEERRMFEIYRGCAKEVGLSSQLKSFFQKNVGKD